MTIREFIELHQQVFGLEKNTFAKIKTKVSRELSKIESWTHNQSGPTVPAGKTKAYELDNETFEQLSKIMKPYFIKISDFEKNELEKEQKRNSTLAYNLTHTFKKSYGDEDPYIFKIPAENKLQVMIEALFYAKFELDEKSWTEDYSAYKIFEDDPDALITDSMAVTTSKLRNPRKYYVRQKSKK